MKVPCVQEALPGVQAAGRAIGLIRSWASAGLSFDTGPSMSPIRTSGRPSVICINGNNPTIVSGSIESVFPPTGQIHCGCLAFKATGGSQGPVTGFRKVGQPVERFHRRMPVSWLFMKSFRMCGLK
jgi:hypothetical protein